MSIRVEVGRLCCEQCGRRPAEFRILSFVAGGPEPQEGSGLGRARTLGSEGAYGTNAPMKRRRAWRRQWPRKSFVLVELYSVSKKNDTDVTHYRFNPHQPISVIFDRDVAERVCY